jgi:protein TonB
MSEGAATRDHAPPAPGPGDRLAVTVLFSIVVHAVVALGITFEAEDPAASLPTLDVTLVATRSPEAPENPDFLANANQQGGGDRAEARRLRQPVPGQALEGEATQEPEARPDEAPPPKPAAPAPVVTTSATSPSRADPPRPEQPEEATPRLITGRELMQRSAEIARLAAEIDRRSEQYARRPRRKFVDANTREYEYAAYMRAWVARVERIGNLNYPEDARQRRLSGNLVLTVAIRRDGSVERIDLIQPSGHRVLDDAAIAVVELAAPFAPLPRTEENVDVLHITRTWQFMPGGLATQ